MTAPSLSAATTGMPEPAAVAPAQPSGRPAAPAVVNLQVSIQQAPAEAAQP